MEADASGGCVSALTVVDWVATLWCRPCWGWPKTRQLAFLLPTKFVSPAICRAHMPKSA